MLILGIDTSCDDTAVAVIRNRQLLASIVSSQDKLHAPFAGVVPEIAARSHIELIDIVTKTALKKAGVTLKEIDMVAATNCPGLVNCLLVGLSYAKTLCIALNKPLVPVNHVYAHIYPVFVNDVKFPVIALVVSGGHTSLFYMETHSNIKEIGKTLDDAAGEAFDKATRILGLPYGGVNIQKAAIRAKEKLKKSDLLREYKFPNVKVKGYNFSFSGLKTALSIVFEKAVYSGRLDVDLIAFAFQEKVTDILVNKTLKAAKDFKVKSLVVCGGVAANIRLREKILERLKQNKLKCKLYIPEFKFCTDNAFMVALRGYFTKGKAVYHSQVSDVCAKARIY